MKKISILLVVAMLFCMIPAFGVSAAEAYTIANADEYIAFVNAINDGSYAGGNSIKVTGDLDFSGKTFVTIGTLPVSHTLDFDGHAIMNVNHTVDGATVDNGEIGFLANGMSNMSCVKNLTIKNSTFTVTGNAVAVGGVVGRLDRAELNNINTDGYTITFEGTKADGGAADVGGMIALQHWTYSDHEVVLSGNLKDLTINAPQANVGIISGWTEDWDATAGMWITVKDVTGNVTADGQNEVTADTLFYAINNMTKLDAPEYTAGADNYYIDAATVKLTVNEDAAGDPPAENPPAENPPAENPPATEPDPDNKGEDNPTPPQTGDVAVFAAVVAVIALAGAAVVSKKRSVR